MEALRGVIACIPTWLVLSIVAGITVFWYLTKKHDHWKRVGIPYVTPIPILGSMLTLFVNSQFEVEVKRYREKGRIYGAYEGSAPVLYVGEPEILKDIYIKDFNYFTAHRNMKLGDRIIDNILPNLMGEDWKRVRALITPTFTTGKIKRMTSILIDSAKTLIGTFKAEQKDGKPLDMKRYFGAFTMDVIASAAFGTKIDSHNDPDNPLVSAARRKGSKAIPWRFIMYFLLPGLMSFFKISAFPPGEFDMFENITLKIIEERKRSGKKRNDFLQLMLDAQKGELEKDEVLEDSATTKEMGHEEGNDQVFKPYHSSKSLSNDEMIAQCIVFFLGGYDSVSSVLSFAAYELALNTDIQERLIAEIDEAIIQQGELNYEAIYGMKYLENVLSETLRKYPPGFRGERLADADYLIKDYNITVPKGMIVYIPIYAIQHDPEHYPDPEKFDPDRFTPEQKSTRHAFTYLPFGAGPRNCVAMRFALMEIKVCLAYVLSQCRFKKCSETQVPLQFYRGQITLQPKEVMLKVEPRHDAKKL